MENEGEEFECPRCAKATSAKFYGPCQKCRSELIDTMRIDRSETEAPEYEPKMNVTPNAVALKE